MDIYLLQTVGHWFSMLAVSFISLFGLSHQDKHIIMQENTSYTKSTTVVSQIIPYDTKYVYNYNVSSDAAPKVITEGVTGISYTYENGLTKTVTEPINEVIEIGMANAQSYTGKMTGYGPDCRGCSGTGGLSCRLANGSKHNLVQDGATYNDSEYGEVRIVAADTSVFPCGTIVMVDNGKLEPFLAVVLDTGYSVKNATANGYIWMDLAFTTESDPNIYASNSNNAKYVVKRTGW